MRILTARLPATDTQPTRIRATILGERPRAVRAVTLGYDHALDFGANHAAAARELMRRNNVAPCLAETCVGIYCDDKGSRMAWAFASACFTTSTLSGEIVVTVTRATY